MRRIVVAGALANRPGNSGGAWVRAHWTRGLARLGFDVLFVEQMDPAVFAPGPGAWSHDPVGALRWFRACTHSWGLDGRSALLVRGGGSVAGLSRAYVERFVESAELLVNLGGHLSDRALLDRFERSAYVDLDPAFTQLWHDRGHGDLGLEEHDVHFTVGLNVGTEGSSLPTGGFDWQGILPPVVLEDVPAQPDRGSRTFTTIGSWRGPFGPIEHDGTTLGLKVHEFRKILGLPGRTGAEFVLALDMHAEDGADRARLIGEGWKLVDPRDVAGHVEGYREFIAGSGAELSAAQGAYVGTRSGWFSDRSAHYLASGRPVVLQDTGFGDHLPTGEGLLSFADVDGAAGSVADIVDDYTRHAQAARALAERHFDSDRVLSRFLALADVDPEGGGCADGAETSRSSGAGRA